MAHTEQDILVGGDKKAEIEEPKLNTDIMFYHDNSLHKHDEKLIDKEIVETKAKKLYDNFHSEEYQNYLRVLDIIPKRFMKKNYKVDYNGNEITIYQLPKSGQPKEMHKIKGPEYIDILDKLDELQKTIRVERQQLLDKYNALLISDNVLPLEKNQFIEDKKQFLENLHEYYSLKKFYMDINDLYDENKKKIVLFSLVKDKHQVNDQMIDNLEGDDYMIKQAIVDKINEQKLEKLNLYNNILKNLRLTEGKKVGADEMKVIEEEIKEYLEMDKEKENERLIDLEIKSAHNMVKTAVIKLPSITNVDKLL